MSKAVKSILVICFVVIFFVVFITYQGYHSLSDELDFYKQKADELNIVKIYDYDSLPDEVLTNRSEDGSIIIERVFGVVINEDTGEGAILSTDGKYYINYSGVKGIHKNDVVLSFFIYNPDTDYEDDIINRFDYVIDRR